MCMTVCVLVSTNTTVTATVCGVLDHYAVAFDMQFADTRWQLEMIPPPHQSSGSHQARRLMHFGLHRMSTVAEYQHNNDMTKTPSDYYCLYIDVYNVHNEIEFVLGSSSIVRLVPIGEVVYFNVSLKKELTHPRYLIGHDDGTAIKAHIYIMEVTTPVKFGGHYGDDLSASGKKIAELIVSSDAKGDDDVGFVRNRNNL